MMMEGRLVQRLDDMIVRLVEDLAMISDDDDQCLLR